MAEAVGTVIAVRPRPRRAVSRTWDFFRRKPMGAIGGATLGLVVLVAVFADLLAPYDPLQEDYARRLLSPNVSHWFGTDTFGRDMFSRVVFGSRISLYVGLSSVIGGSMVGILIGLTSGYVGGWVDLAVQRVIDALMGFPGLVLALALVAALGASLNNVAIAIGVTFMPRVARLARASALSIRQEDYILAARAVGVPLYRIMLRHVFPNSLAPLIVLATGYLGAAIASEAGLSFLGLGVPPPHPSWGQMLQLATKRWLEAAPWLALFPGAALTLTVFGFNLFGDALRDILDPRLRGR